MRKLVLVMLVCMAFAVPALAAETTPASAAQGQIDFGVMGGLDVPMGKLSAKSSDTEFGAEMKVGYGGGLFMDYFLTPMMALGLDGQYVTMTNKNDSSGKAKTAQYGVHGKYVLPTGGPVGAYLQLGFAMYNRKLEGKDGDISISVSDTKPGFNAGVGVGYKVTPMVAIGVNGMYNMAFGKFEPEIGGEKVELLKDWNYITFNAALTFTMPKK